jgi:beta-galactosidase
MIEQFDWKNTKRKQVAILPDVSIITEEQMRGIETFVGNGNKIIATGLTGFYDESEKSWMVNRSHPLEAVLGGKLKEVFGCISKCRGLKTSKFYPSG